MSEMSKFVISSDEFERFQKVALELAGVIFTSELAPHLIAVRQNMQLRFGAKLAEKVASLHCEDYHLLHALEPELSVFLKQGTRDRLQKELSLFLHSLLKGLRLHDVHSELLIQWISEFGSSSSPNLEKINSGDSVAADPHNNGTPDTSEKGVNGDA